MKIISAIFPTLLLAAGCVYNRPPTYTATPVFRDDLVSPQPATDTIPKTQSDADRDLAMAVRHQFDRYGELSGLLPNIDITADRGTVTLMGSVPGAQDKQMIDALVRNTPGIIGVNNLLRAADSGEPLEPTGRGAAPGESPDDYFNLHVQGLTDTDRILGQQILAGLRTDAVLASSVPRVNIYVADGTVTLRGIVQTEEQRRAIANTVRSATGVSSVRNELKVQRLPR